MSRVLAANLGFLWAELPVGERVERAARAGFDAVELHDEAQREGVEEVRAALRAAGLPLLGLNVRMGATRGRAAIPGQEARAREDAEEAVEIARSLGARAIHVMGGVAEPTPEALSTYRRNLAHACDAAAPHGVSVLIEPICEAAAPGYVLSRVGRAAEVVAEVARPNLRILFDVWHVAQAGDPLGATFAAHAPLIGHVQIADPASRAEPRLGGPPERDVGALALAFEAAGYRGAYGCEYRPAGTPEEGLGWLTGFRGAAAGEDG